MLTIVRTSQFKKDYKRVRKRGLPQAALVEILKLLATQQELPIRCRPHKLSGNYAGTWECHIQPDWLLIYEVVDGELRLKRTGSHADLFS